MPLRSSCSPRRLMIETPGAATVVHADGERLGVEVAQRDADRDVVVGGLVGHHAVSGEVVEVHRQPRLLGSSQLRVQIAPLAVLDAGLVGQVPAAARQARGGEHRVAAAQDALLLDHDDLLAGGRGLQRGHHAGRTGAGHHHVAAGVGGFDLGVGRGGREGLGVDARLFEGVAHGVDRRQAREGRAGHGVDGEALVAHDVGAYLLDGHLGDRGRLGALDHVDAQDAAVAVDHAQRHVAGAAHRGALEVLGCHRTGGLLGMSARGGKRQRDGGRGGSDSSGHNGAARDGRAGQSWCLGHGVLLLSLGGMRAVLGCGQLRPRAAGTSRGRSRTPRWARNRPSEPAGRVGTEQYGGPRPAARSFVEKRP